MAGRTEGFSAAFRVAVERLLDDPRPALGTIALHGPAFVEVVRGRPDVELVEVTPGNREDLVGEVGAWLRRGHNNNSPAHGCQSR
jgi:nucleoside-triphosphatase THEP1